MKFHKFIGMRYYVHFTHSFKKMYIPFIGIFKGILTISFYYFVTKFHHSFIEKPPISISLSTSLSTSTSKCQLKSTTLDAQFAKKISTLTIVFHFDWVVVQLSSIQVA